MHLSTLVPLIVGSLAIASTMIVAARAIWRMGGSAHDLIGAVQDNTAATERLSGDLQDFSARTAQTLADHGARIAALEHHRRR